MTRQRVDEFVIETEIQSDFLVEEVGAGVKVLEPLSVDVSSIRKELIQDQRSTGRNKGELPPIVGVYRGVSVPITAYAEGIRALPAEGAAAQATSLCHLLASTAQDVQYTKSSKATGVPTVSSIVESVDDGHAVAAVNGSTTAIGCFTAVRAADGLARTRFYTYTAATDTIAPLFAMDAALAADDVIYGGAVFQCAEQWDTGFMPYPLTVRLLGNDDEQNAKLIGTACSLSVADTDVNAVPVLSFNANSAYAVNKYSDTRPSASPAEVSVWAGGEILFAPASVSTYKTVQGSVSFKVAQNWVTIRAPGGPTNPYGIQDFQRGVNADEFVVVVPADVTPNDLGATATNWLDIIESTSTVAADKNWHLQASFGSTPGRIFSVMGPDLVIVNVEESTLDDFHSYTITLRPKRNSVFPAWAAALT